MSKKNKKKHAHHHNDGDGGKKPKKMSIKAYEKELARLEIELVKLQGWIVAKGLKVAVVFEGRDSAGKGGTIKRITNRLNPRVARHIATPTPTERQKSEWFFQRYVPHLPAAGEMCLFDRSWYNRSGVERVMGFCTDDELAEFYATVNPFELAQIRSGTILIKYWLDISDETQEKTLEAQPDGPGGSLPLGGSFQGSRRSVGANQHRACALVSRGCQCQAACPFERHHPPAQHDPV